MIPHHYNIWTISLVVLTSLIPHSGQATEVPLLQIQVAVVGSDAERLMDRVMEMPGARILENSVNLTTWQFEHVTCTLFGAHAGSPDFLNPYYRCSVEL